MADLWELIQTYFPEREWQNALCMAKAECGSATPCYPQACVTAQGLIQCGDGQAVEARAWGPFQILDACWNPALNPASPFTAAQWAQVLDPNVNVWMASAIWSASGWEAWTTCNECKLCQSLPGDIPYPDGPLPELSRDWPPLRDISLCGAPVGHPSAEGLPLLLGLAAIIGAGLLVAAKGERR